MRTDPAPRRTRTSIVVALSVVAVLASLIMPWTPTAPAPQAEAATASNFDAGNIISDANFFDGDAMSASQVQTFMQQRRPDCAAGYTCLPQYAQATPTMAENRFCSGIAGSAGESAASIVSRVALACNVSPRVLLVLLEKEQSLVTHRSPSGTRYSSATGFACPDTAPCDSSFGGFFYQVYYAARQFQVYRAFPASYNHQPAAWNNILFNPNAACGTSRVYVANQATAGLYNYTPYQPNAAALANLYGTGDSCSAYGNRNFWRIFTDWFGDPRGTLPGDPSPIGRLEAVTAAPGSVRLQGWAFDPDSAGSLDIHVYINQAGSGSYRADLPRPDVAAAYGRSGAHGFDVTIPVRAADYEVCVAFINVGAGQNVWSCQTASQPSGAPMGSVDSMRVEGRNMVIEGWTIDPDTVDPIAVHAYVNGSVWGGAVTANRARPDVARMYPGYGAAHGFRIVVPLPVGTNDVQVAFVNVGGGSNTWKGPFEGRLESGSPIGGLDVVRAAGPGTVSLAGWALDPDTAASVQMHVYVNGVARGSLQADRARSDVARAYPGYGEARGFSTTLTGLGGGRQEVCVAAINVRYGSNTWFCRTVVLPTGAPFGNFESAVVGPGSISVAGWTIDPDTSSAVQVHMYVDGRGVGAITANGSRPDVGRANAGYGDAHGFSSTISGLSGGRHEVCLAAINVGTGTNTWFCRTVTLPSGSPFGSVDAVSVSGSTAVLSGWAIDPDTAASAEIHVYVSNAWGGRTIAAAQRPDVARAYPGYGSARGFSVSVPIPPGTSQVCAAIINVGAGSNTWLPCQTVRR